ncbi:MAG: hypothetical protein M1821_008614 [Bathelium mastoideum]|nr:MAG: hypothetical protein M1821_008614 [Bathelium mastoideum]
MSFSKIATGLVLFTASAHAASYTLQKDYMKDEFWNNWDFQTMADPTNGTVQYVDQATAASTSMGRDPLINRNANGSYYMGADHNTTTTNGRPSLRLQSKDSYNSGLFVLDLSHMPGGECASWPAFWLLGYKNGQQWPAGGEVDIIEGVNNQNGNDMTLHTNPGCSLKNNGGFSGQMQLSKMDCGAGGGHEGCQIADQQGGGSANGTNPSFGAGFNAAGGGVYATEWLPNGFAIWFVPRSDRQRLKQIKSDTPDPSTWGKPLALFNFQPGCTMSSNFVDMKMIFDLTFCGDWAGSTDQPGYGWLANNCNAKGSCPNFVNSQPHNFDKAFWTINSLKVFQSGAGNSTGNSTEPSVAPSPMAASSAPEPSSTLPPSSTVYSTTFTTVNMFSPAPEPSTADWSEGANGAVQAAATKKARHLGQHGHQHDHLHDHLHLHQHQREHGQWHDHDHDHEGHPWDHE